METMLIFKVSNGKQKNFFLEGPRLNGVVLKDMFPSLAGLVDDLEASVLSYWDVTTPLEFYISKISKR